MSYRVIRLELETARDRAPLDIPGNEITIQTVPGPFTVRIGSRDADPILINRPGRVLRCPGPMGSIYITNESGAGVAELVVGDVRLDFSGGSAGGGVAAGPAQILVHSLNPLTQWYSGMNACQLGLVKNISINRSGSGGVVQNSPQYSEVLGITAMGTVMTGEPGGHAVWGPTGQNDSYVPIPVQALLDIRSRARHLLGIWRLEDTIWADRLANVRLHFGMGNAFADGLQGPAFFIEGDGRIMSYIGMPAFNSTTVTAVEYTGVDLTQPRRLAVEMWGEPDGRGAVDWSIDGFVVRSFRGGLVYDRDALQRAEMWQIRAHWIGPGPADARFWGWLDRGQMLTRRDSA